MTHPVDDRFTPKGREVDNHRSFEKPKDRDDCLAARRGPASARLKGEET
jgi:hypothetical protein